MNEIVLRRITGAIPSTGDPGTFYFKENSTYNSIDVWLCINDASLKPISTAALMLVIGHTLLSSASNPTSLDGNDGDFWYNTTTKFWYGPKASGTWPAGFSIIGPTGPAGATGAPGADGKTVLNGSGVPSGALGVNGDFYIDTTAWDVYGPKAGGVWGSGTSIIGPAGPTGATGSAGAPGVDGFSVLSGSGAPSGGLGADGDFYIDTSTWEIYGPKTSGAWGSGVSLIGPTGLTGATGQGFTWQSFWAPGSLTGYNPYDVVFYSGSTYLCLAPNSGSVVPPDSDPTNWQLFTQQGAPGTNGLDGKTVLNGTGAPSGGTGVNGDFYIDTAAWNVYGPKAAGVWGSGTSIIGPAGPTGATGSTGAAGADGMTVRNGSGVPSGALGVNGDFYIDTTAWLVYGPKTAGAWGSGTSIIGPTGPAGATGPAGSTLLSGLTDVNLSSPSNLQQLRYDFATSKWVNFTETIDTVLISGNATTAARIINTGTNDFTIGDTAPVSNGVKWGFTQAAGHTFAGNVVFGADVKAANSPTYSSGGYHYTVFNDGTGRLEKRASVPWGDLTSVPTTVAGYGITDAFKAGGNSFGADTSLGLGDSFKLSLITAGSVRAYCDSSGNWSFGSAVSTSNATASFRNGSGPIAGLFGGSGGSASAVGLGSVAGGAFIQGYNATASATTNLVMQTSGSNVLIGTSTDGGEKFQVNGSMAFDLGSDAAGDIFYRNSSGTFARLALGTTNKILQATSGAAPAWQTPTTDHLTEGTNLFYTDVRARASNSAGTGVGYNSTTGVVNAHDVIYKATGVNMKTVANTTVFTTESGRGRFFVRLVIIHMTAVSGSGSNATSVSLGVTSAAFADICAAQSMAPLSAANMYGPMTLVGPATSLAASTAVVFKVTTGATYTTATADIYVYGFYESFA